MNAAEQGALAGITIIEIAERPAGEYTGKLLADLGAVVIKVERPGGAPTRHMGPFKGGESAVFGFFNTSKKSVVLDLGEPEGRAALDRLMARANALIDDHPEAWDAAHHLTHPEVAKTHPHLVHCSITPFGQGAPPEWQNAQPINVMSAGGWAYHSPSESPQDKPPLKGAGRFQPDYESGIDAAMCLLASLLRQRRASEGTRTGQFIDISEVEVQLNRIDCVLDRMLAGEAEPSADRTAYDMGGPATSFSCKDGHVYLFMTTQAQWKALCDLMGQPEWAAQFPLDWLEFHCIPERVAAFRAHFTGWIAGQEKLPITAAAQKAGLAMVPVNTAADLPQNEQFIHRGFFQSARHPTFGDVVYPSAPYRMSATPARVISPAPALGAHNGEFGTLWAEPEKPARDGPVPAKRGRGGPLAGVRVLEITKVWAGPYAGKMLAHLGAEVIKLESATNLDEMRAYGGVDINSAPYFLSINQEILSAQVNMKTAEGLDLVRQLVAKSDIVIDNIRPGAMERSALGYDNLKQIKPDIIQCSIKMWGNDGPLGYQTGYAPCFAALSGLSYLVGHEGETPRGMNIRHGDSTVGAAAALACIAALHHRDHTGEGQFIDLSAVETMTSLVGDSLFAYSVTGEVPKADGNFHPSMAPHGAYPCDHGEWLSIAVADDATWQALTSELGWGDLAADLRFGSLASRLLHRQALDAAICTLTTSHSAGTLADRLRRAGVPAFRSQSSIDLCADGWLWGREAFRMVSDHRTGTRPIIGPSWRMEPDAASVTRGAPLLGEHNDYVYSGILGLSPQRLDDLIASRVIL